MIYSVWLFGLGSLFVVLERIWPRNKSQGLLRKGFFSDLVYIIFNSEYLGILLGLASVELIRVLGLQRLQIGLLSGLGFWEQFFAFFLIFDFLQWCIHNLLHRVGWLWEFHKVHHSIVELDWIGNWRFHWVEIVVYRSLLYVPAALCGFRGDAMFWAGVFNTLVGHFAHANLSWRVGALKYVINSPEMHAWHHNHPDQGPVNRNFALTLSVWDWLFGTAHVPGQDPARLGFPGIERYPEQLPGQLIEPFRGLFRKS